MFAFRVKFPSQLVNIQALHHHTPQKSQEPERLLSKEAKDVVSYLSELETTYLPVPADSAEDRGLSRLSRFRDRKLHLTTGSIISLSLCLQFGWCRGAARPLYC